MINTNFVSREDYEEALMGLCRPLKKYFTKGNTGIYIGYTSAHYGDKIIGLEAYSRILWGIVPYMVSGKTTPLDEEILRGLKNGINPENEEYWGTYEDGSQAFVEMAVLGFALLMVPERFWDPLSGEERRMFSAWLNQINEHEISDNNWLFFRILVNCGLRKNGGCWSEERLSADLARIEDFYLGDGWYSDGKTAQRDYYISFAMHFYSLIYAGVMKKEDPERAAVYIQRGERFAQDFMWWFARSGEAIPYGRSLTYRFAQTAFWAALAFSGSEAVPWGILRGLISRHFRYWFRQPILDCEDKLTIGYAYPNLNMAEGYNSPSSPYWAMKSFLVLALPKEHPFWKAEERELPAREGVRMMPHAGMLVRERKNGHVMALTSGQYCAWKPAHYAEKYEKFAYSTGFGFQVPRSYRTLEQAAPDNMLSLYKDGYWHVRTKCEAVEITEERIVSSWIPFDGVHIETELSFEAEGCRCRHTIQSDGVYQAAAAGFALPFSEKEELDWEAGEGSARIRGKKGSCGIIQTEGKADADFIYCEPNVNLLYPRTVLPCLQMTVRPGINIVEYRIEGEMNTD